MGNKSFEGGGEQVAPHERQADEERRLEQINGERDRIWDEFVGVRDKFLAYVGEAAQDSEVSPASLATMPDFDGMDAAAIYDDFVEFLKWLEKSPNKVADALKSGLGGDFIEAVHAFCRDDRALKFEIMRVWAEDDQGVAKVLDKIGERRLGEEEAHEEARLMRARLQELGISLEHISAKDYEDAAVFLEGLSRKIATESPDSKWMYDALNILLAPSEKILQAAKVGIDATAAKILVLAPILGYVNDVWMGEALRTVSALRHIELASEHLRRLEALARQEELAKANEVKVLKEK